jgi:hypothetical protein
MNAIFCRICNEGYKIKTFSFSTPVCQSIRNNTTTAELTSSDSILGKISIVPREI